MVASNPGLGGVAAINNAAGIAPDSDSTLSAYDSTQGNKGGLRGLGAGAPMQITPQQGGLGQGRITPPQSPPSHGSDPAPGILGSIGLTQSGAGALLQGVAGFMSAAGKGTLLGGLGSAITGATGSMAAADKQRQDQAQQDFENQVKAAQANENQQKNQQSLQDAQRAAATSEYVADGKGGVMLRPGYADAQEALEKDKPVPVGRDATGAVVYGVKRDGKYYNPITDRPLSEEQQQAAKQQESVVASGQFNYAEGGPGNINKGDKIPEPVPIVGKSVESLKGDAATYAATGVLPPKGSTKSPLGLQQQKYRDAVENYANAAGLAKGLTPEAQADLRRFGVKAAQFPLSRQGDQTVAIGTALRHTEALRGYAEAWKASRGVDTPFLREAGARFQKAFGSAAPTNLEAAARIAGPEIVKAIGVAGAGTGGERFAQEEGFQPGASDPQIFGAINVAQQFLAGQLPAKEAQARNVGFPIERFKDMVGKSEYDRLTELQKGGAASSGSSVPPPAQRQTGTVYQTPKGPMTWMGNGWQQ
jgi:hypothetical protein